MVRLAFEVGAHLGATAISRNAPVAPRCAPTTADARSGVRFDAHPQLAVDQSRSRAGLRAPHPRTLRTIAAVVVLQDRIAARDGGQRTDRFERTREPAQTQCVALQAPRDRGLRTLARARPGVRAAATAAVAAGSRAAPRRRGAAVRARVRAAAPGGVEPAHGFALAPAQRIQPRLRAQRVAGATRRDRRAASPGAGAARAGRAGAGAGRAGACSRSSRLGASSSAATDGVGARRSAAKSAEAEVGLVSDRGHHRHRRGRDRARQALRR